MLKCYCLVKRFWTSKSDAKTSNSSRVISIRLAAVEGMSDKLWTDIVEPTIEVVVMPFASLIPFSEEN